MSLQTRDAQLFLRLDGTDYSASLRGVNTLDEIKLPQHTFKDPMRMNIYVKREQALYAALYDMTAKNPRLVGLQLSAAKELGFTSSVIDIEEIKFDYAAHGDNYVVCCRVYSAEAYPSPASLEEVDAKIVELKAAVIDALDRDLAFALSHNLI